MKLTIRSFGWLFYFARFAILLLLSAKSLGQDLRQLAVEKFGDDSHLWFAEPVDTSLSQWVPPNLISDRGIILEWNQQKVVLVRPDAQKETSIVGDYAVRIEPSLSNEAGKNVHRAFCQRDYPSVLSNGRAAVASGLPRWQQRLILAEMVDAASALGKTHDAGLLFASLAKDNPPCLLLSTIPIPWGDDVVAADMFKLQGSAEKWIGEEQEALQLLGASWLLSGKKRTEAVETLETLGRSSKVPIIAAYAKAQLWRTLPPSDLLSDKYPKWIAERDKLLHPLQAGPSMLLAERLAQAGQPALAIPEWLRVSRLHQDREHLASKAMSKSIEALKSLGRNDEAALLEKKNPK
jgi:hypothetical protein